jgi:hypothetical protein
MRAMKSSCPRGTASSKPDHGNIPAPLPARPRICSATPNSKRERASQILARKKARSFLKKRTKKLLLLRLACSPALIQKIKSFLLLFFKKEVLP